MTQNLKLIYLTEPHEIAYEAVQLLTAAGYVVITDLNLYSKEVIKGLFIRSYTKVTAEFLDEFPRLEFILRAGVGLDNIDLIACRKRKIAIYNSPGANAVSVAEYVLTMSLYTLREVGPQLAQVRGGKWRNYDHVGENLAGKVFGLIGCGNVGGSLAPKLHALGAKCYGYDPYVDESVLRNKQIVKCELLYLLQHSDLIVLMLPLTPETKGIISKKEFNLMQSESIFINVSRGELIDESALVDALTANRLKCAVLDVLTGEPVVDEKLIQCPNLIITPHIAGFTRESNIQIAVGAVKNLLESKK